MRTTNHVFKIHTVLFWVLYMLVCLQWRSKEQNYSYSAVLRLWQTLNYISLSVQMK
jgi:hypothetical protein